MSWMILVIAGLFEVGFAACLGKARLSTGITAVGWYTGFLVCLTISMLLLIKATQELPIGTAYAVWTGIGAVGTVIIGIFFFKESADWVCLSSIMMIVIGMVGLKLSHVD